MPRATRVHKRVNYQELDSEDEIKTHLAKRRATSHQKQPVKRTKQPQRKVPTTAAEAGPGYVENTIFSALSDPQSNVEEESRQWLEQYEDTPAAAIANFINLLLRSCGCVTQIQEHDTETESQTSTVAEIVAAFSEQGYHEYPFGSKQPDRKFFRDNVIEFMERLVEIAHDKGMLDDDKFMSHLLAWCTPFTTCNIRPLRHIFTITVLTMQSSLCDVMTLIFPALEKALRQLANASKGRSKRTAKNALESLQFTVNTFTAQKNTIESLFLINTEAVFIHRYRDLDSLIRQECVKSLGYAIDTYPDYFFQASYLRYLGWLLSDPVSLVRAEVVRILVSLYEHATARNKTLDTGFRQFTERFKSQLMLMATRDDDAQVRLRSTSICCLLLKIGFLNDQETKTMGTSILRYFAATPGSTTDARTKEKMVRFMDLVTKAMADTECEKFTEIIDSYADSGAQNNFSITNAIKVKCIINYLRDIASVDGVDIHEVLPTLFMFLSQVPNAVSWDFVIQYYLMDTSSLQLDDDTELEYLRSLIDISEPTDQLFVALYILGSILWLYQVTLLRKLEKNADALTEPVEETQLKLVELVPQLAKQLVKSSDQCGILVRLWTLLLRPSPVFGSLYNGFKLIGQLHVYNDVNKDLLMFFDEYEPKQLLQNHVLDSFKEFFVVILLAYDTKTGDEDVEDSQISTPEVRIVVQNVTLSLATGVQELIKTCETTANPPLSQVMEISTCILKLFMLSEHIDIVSIIDGKIKTQSICLSIPNVVMKDISILKEIIENTQNTKRYLQDLSSIAFASLSFLSNVTSIQLESIIAASLHNVELLDTDLLTVFEYLSPSLATIVNLQEQVRDCIFLVGNLEQNLQNSIPDRQECLESLNQLSTLLGSKLIDLLIPIRFFYLKCKDMKFTGFDDLFAYDQLGKYATTNIDILTEQGLLFPFLVHESKLAQLKGTEIKKSESESASIEEVAAIMVTPQAVEQSLMELDDDDEEEEDAEIRKEVRINLEEQNNARRREEQIWQCEKDLCVYTMRLLALQLVALLTPDVIERIGANASALGGAFNSTISNKFKKISGDKPEDQSSSSKEK